MARNACQVTHLHKRFSLPAAASARLRGIGVGTDDGDRLDAPLLQREKIAIVLEEDHARARRFERSPLPGRIQKWRREVGLFAVEPPKLNCCPQDATDLVVYGRFAERSGLDG